MAKRSITLVALVGSFTMAGCTHFSGSQANEESAEMQQQRATGAALAEAKDCTVCHDVRSDRVGPAFRRVARKYGGMENGREQLLEVVQAGTKRSTSWHWGSVTMPDDESVRMPVSEDEAELLVDYVLSLE